MKSKLSSVAVVVLVWASAVMAQSSNPPAAVPDLSGTYLPGGGPLPAGLRNVGFPVTIPYPPAAAAKAKALPPDADPGARCIPRGAVRQLVGAVNRFDIVQTPKVIYIFFNQRSPKQVIYMDGREHPKNLRPTYYGHAIGHWERDTLVVDIVGEHASTLLETPNAQRGPIIHSDALHVIYRFRKVQDGSFLEVQVTIEDPKTFSTPMTVSRYFRTLPPGQEEPEYVCEEGIELEGDF